eukprot:TRINITY_DN23684_c0_g1_i1.p1 TRINITY_DN23684_c0_g1~~TRINITY_DN23684_c0_g1_i1.p1  ORF type:complete len:187 (-),score=47.14 TRINITY_DN23684_c0_g1_i1:11-571(-)
MAWRGLSSRLGLSLALVSFARCSGAVRVGDDTRPAATGRSRLSSSDRQLSGTDAVQKEEEELERMDREQFDDMIHMMAAMNVLKQPSDEDASAASEIGGMSKEARAATATLRLLKLPTASLLQAAAGTQEATSRIFPPRLPIYRIYPTLQAEHGDAAANQSVASDRSSPERSAHVGSAGDASHPMD